MLCITYHENKENESDVAGITVHSGTRVLRQGMRHDIQRYTRTKTRTSRDRSRTGASAALMFRCETDDDRRHQTKRANGRVTFIRRQFCANLMSFNGRYDGLDTHPLGVVEMGLKSIRPASTKCRRTSDQSSRESQEIRPGASTSTGITWLMSPHWMRMTAVPVPPERRHRSSRR